jgi:uncharacterized protein YjiS (DUF1127 family)
MMSTPQAPDLRHDPDRLAGNEPSCEKNSSLAAAVARILGLWLTRRGHRRALRDLAERDYLLADVGLTREEALREARKPFWRP